MNKNFIKNNVIGAEKAGNGGEKKETGQKENREALYLSST
jgi:hypothetical protein